MNVGVQWELEYSGTYLKEGNQTNSAVSGLYDAGNAFRIYFETKYKEQPDKVN